MGVLPAAAAALTLVLAAYVWTTVILLRQNGRLLLRVDALEERIGLAVPEQPGLPIGRSAPAFSLQGLDDETVTLESLSNTGKAVVLIFAEPGCGPCEDLFPEVAQWQRVSEERRTIALISSGRIEANRNRRDRNGLRRVFVQAGREVAQAYRANATPSAVLIREGRIASALAQGAEEIRSLIARASLPPAVKKGDPAPSLELSDLDGHVVDLATLRGRNTLVMFWDPANGNCQSMLPDLKTSERVRLANAPDLLFIASGSADANRAQGFRSRILLDPHLAGRTVFGVEDAPAAVLIDEQGRVASDVRAGYVMSFELTGLVPFVPSPDETVDAMLTLAGVTQGDVVYDLGCGDGRIVIAAAKTYGVHGVGVDINPERLAEGRANATAASVEHLVRFEERELCDADLRGATVVTMYLLPTINLQVRSKLLAELKPGARVVSHAFDMGDWTPDRQIEVNGDSIYLWTIPARP